MAQETEIQALKRRVSRLEEEVENLRSRNEQLEAFIQHELDADFTDGHPEDTEDPESSEGDENQFRPN